MSTDSQGYIPSDPSDLKLGIFPAELIIIFAGWLYKIQLSNVSELDSLMKEPAYEALIRSLQDESN